MKKKGDLTPYLKLFSKIKKKLRLKTAVELRPADWWYFYVPSDKQSFMIYCPPYHEIFEPDFVHYLCHAKLLEEGWKRPWMRVYLTSAHDLKKIKRYRIRRRRSMLFYWASRAADSFFDFFVFRHLVKNIGPRYFLNFIGNMVDFKKEQWLKEIDRIYKHSSFNYPVYTFCLDWFAMIYSVAREVDRSLSKKLETSFNELLQEDEFIQKTLPDIGKRIKWARRFYQQLAEKYPNYREALRYQAREFLRYHDNVWKGSGLRVEITSLV